MAQSNFREVLGFLFGIALLIASGILLGYFFYGWAIFISDYQESTAALKQRNQKFSELKLWAETVNETDASEIPEIFELDDKTVVFRCTLSETNNGINLLWNFELAVKDPENMTPLEVHLLQIGVAIYELNLPSGSCHFTSEDIRNAFMSS